MPVEIIIQIQPDKSQILGDISKFNPAQKEVILKPGVLKMQVINN